MKSMHIFLFCSLAAVTLSSVFGNNSINPRECCFDYYPRKLSPKRFESYFMTDSRCPSVGVILMTKRNIRICANPTTSWVEKIMKYLDESTF
ncbi:C-C motif chemokine 36.1 [Syngnathus scovelli]|uniref:C-C motif chemokine 36.1 n=1 Tax=Syngnathus scovelli TaxID=161590 RepID=UPI0021100C8B|nr:C-C motif chemokine 36.1 [Syngnathus scovelli]